MKKILTLTLALVLSGCAALDFLKNRPVNVHFVGSTTLARPLSPTIDNMISAQNFNNAVAQITDNRNVQTVSFSRANFNELVPNVNWLDNLDYIYMFTIINPLASVDIAGETFNVRRPVGFLFKGNITRDQLTNWISLWNQIR